MPDYPIPFTAEEIQGYLNKVATPDGSPVPGSQSLITSGAVKSALDTIELLGGGGGINSLTKEDIEALGINITLDQIGDLDQLTLGFNQITGDVSVNLNDITDIGNLFINADQITTGIISADRISEISLSNIESIANLRIDASHIDNLTIDVTDIGEGGLNNRIEEVAGNVDITVEQLENISNWSTVGTDFFTSNNTALETKIGSVAGDLSITADQLSNITSFDQVNGDFANSVNTAIATSVNNLDGTIDTRIGTAISQTTIGEIGGDFATSLNTLLEQTAVTVDGNQTIDIDRITNITSINDLGGNFANSVNSAISNAITTNNGDFQITASNLTNTLSIDDFHGDFATSINTAIGNYINVNSGDLTFAVDSVSNTFDLSSLSDLGSWNSFIGNAIANVVTVQNGDIIINAENVTSSIIFDYENLPGDVERLVDGLIENNAVKIDAALVNGALNLGPSPTAGEQAAFDSIMQTIEGNISIDVNALTGSLNIGDNSSVTINADVITGVLPSNLDYSNVTLNAGSQLTGLGSAVAAAGGVVITDVAGQDTVNFNNIAVEGLSIEGADVAGFPELQTAVGAINFQSIMGGSQNFSGINVTGLTSSSVSDLGATIDSAIANLSFSDIDSTGDIDFTGINVSGLSTMGLGISDIGGLQSEIDSIAASATFESLSGNAINLSGVTVTGLNVGSVTGAVEQSDITSSINSANFGKGQIDFIDNTGNIKFGTATDEIGIAPGALSINVIENYTTEIESIAANLSLDYLEVDENGDVDLTDVNVTGLNFDLGEVGNTLSASTQVVLPQNVTLSASSISGSLTATQLGITQGNLDILGADLDFIDSTGTSVTIDADAITGTLDLGSLNYSGAIPAIYVSGISIDVNNLTASDFQTIASQVQGDINVNISQVQDSTILFDVDGVTGDTTIRADAIRGNIDPVYVTVGGGSFAGLPPNVTYRQVKILDNGNMNSYYIPTWSGYPG